MEKPNRKVKDVIVGIFGFFYEVDPDRPFECGRQRLYINNIDLFNKRVNFFTKKYADPSLPYKEYNSWDFSRWIRRKDINISFNWRYDLIK